MLSGSVAITGEGNDADIIVFAEGLSPEATTELQEWLKGTGYSNGGSEPPSDAVDASVSLKNNEVNIILCKTIQKYTEWIAATEVCQYLYNTYGACATRDERVFIFRRFRGDLGP